MILSLLGKIASGETDFEERELPYLLPYIDKMKGGVAEWSPLHARLLAGARREWHQRIKAEYALRWFMAFGKSNSDAVAPDMEMETLSGAMAGAVTRGEVKALKSMLVVLDMAFRDSKSDLTTSGERVVDILKLRLCNMATMEFVAQAGYEETLFYLLEIAAEKKCDKKMKDFLTDDYLATRLIWQAACNNYNDMEDKLWDFVRTYDAEAEVAKQAAQFLLYYRCHQQEPERLAATWEHLVSVLGPDVVADLIVDREAAVIAAVMGLESDGQVPALMRMVAKDCPPEKVKEIFVTHSNSLMRTFFSAENFNAFAEIITDIGGPALLAEILRQDNGQAWQMAAGNQDVAVLDCVLKWGGEENLRALAEHDDEFLKSAIQRASPKGFYHLCRMVEKVSGKAPLHKMLLHYDAVYLAARLDYPEMLEEIARLGLKGEGSDIALPVDTVQLMDMRRERKIRATEYWQRMGGHELRWQGLARTAPPEGVPAHWSPFGFKPKLFAELRDALAAADLLEDTEMAAQTAYKLAVLFANREEVERYLARAVAQAAPQHSDKPIKRACEFKVPLRGMWDGVYWKRMILKFGRNAGCFLEHAPEIEDYCAEKGLKLPENVAGLRAVAARVIYKRADENPEFAELALDYGLSRALFEKGLGVLAEAKKEDRMPDITIDGVLLGLDNYYMQKLPANDPRGLVLGHLTNNCQYLGGNGEYAAVLGMTSPDSGFYVWKQKSKGKMTPQDRIVAQSWAWRAADGKSVVFDSFERLAPAYNDLARPFLEQYAYDLKKAGALTRVFLGAGGMTPQDTGLSKTTRPQKPLVPFALEDSKQQYVVPPVDRRRGPAKNLALAEPG